MYLQSEKWVGVLEQFKGQVLDALAEKRGANFGERQSQTEFGLLGGAIRHVAVFLGHGQDALVHLPRAGRLARRRLDFAQVISLCKVYGPKVKLSGRREWKLFSPA